jgi:hypothetical protein
VADHPAVDRLDPFAAKARRLFRGEVLDDPAYDLGAPATAAVTLTFDVDVFGCDTPTS